MVITILADGTHWVVDAWVLDIMGFLMGLFRLLKWDEVYVTPVGVTPWSNIVSKGFLGKAFTVTALIGVLSLVKKSKN